MSMPPPVHTASAPIPNHLAWAIVSTIVGFCLCCPSIISGITAIVFASQVNTKANAGDLDGARRASSNAKTWSIVTTVLAAIGLLINIGFLATGGMTEYMQAVEQIQQMQ